MFVYSFVFDEAQTQFKMVGLPDSEAHQFAPLGAAVQDLWYVSTGSWFDRQADLRQTMGREGLGASMWFRGAVDRSERELSHSQGVSTFDNSQSQNSWAVTFGGDVISTIADGHGVVAGLMLGYAHADMDFENYATQDRLSGMTGGLYASYMNSGFYVDATVNAAGLTIDHDAPSLGLVPAGTVLTGNVETIGAQIETGWRIPLGGAIFIEPVAGGAYVQTSFDDLAVPVADGSIPPTMIEFDGLTSLRGNVGARIGIDQNVGPVLARYSLTARLWNEFDGEGGVTIHAGENIDLSDDVGGRFTELGAGVALFSADGALSGS